MAKKDKEEEVKNKEFVFVREEEVPVEFYGESYYNDGYQNVVHDAYKKEISPILKNSQVPVLDIGCGTGRLAEFFKKEDYYGIDISPVAVNMASKRSSNVKISDMIEIPFPEEMFGYCVMLQSLEHTMDPMSALKEAYRVLANKGRIIVITPITHCMKEEHTIALFHDNDVASLLEKAGFVDTSFYNHEFFPGQFNLVTLGLKLKNVSTKEESFPRKDEPVALLMK